MEKPAVYTLTSPLHDPVATGEVSASFLDGIASRLGYGFDIKGEDFSGYGTSPLDLIFVRTGGTEGIFKELLPKLKGHILLLTSGSSNSLAASMEILSYLRQQGRTGEIIHGSLAFIAERISVLMKVSKARKELSSCRFGVIGHPSDWLISSAADYDAVKRKLGAELVDISMQEILDEISAVQSLPEEEIAKALPDRFPYTKWTKDASAEGSCISASSLSGALRIYVALRRIVSRYSLSGFTLRCFDLLGPVGNTGCLALAMLNSEGIVAGCEGDVPAMLSMAVSRALTGSSGFQSNPSRIDVQSREILFAHCTVPFDMLSGYTFNTHFESGLGVAVHGEMPLGGVTVFKISGDLSRVCLFEGELLDCPYGKSLCRTQLLLHADEDISQMLTSPVGNHHIVISGRHSAVIKAFLEGIS